MMIIKISFGTFVPAPCLQWWSSWSQGNRNFWGSATTVAGFAAASPFPIGAFWMRWKIGRWTRLI